MSDPFHALALAAAEIKRSVPQEFEKLLEAVRGLEEKIQLDFNSAGPEVIFPLQGKVQFMAQLRKKFETCQQIAEQARR